MIATLLIALATLASCAVHSIPALPFVRLVTSHAAHLEGARAWDALGFTAEIEDSSYPHEECSRRWYLSEPRETDCQITIGVVIDPLLIERTGSDAAASREFRTVYLAPSVQDLEVALAHEVGHIVLDTPRHTQGGVMGGASSRLRDVDYQLACETIGVCS